MLPDAFHQVSAQSDLPFGSRQQFKIFKMAAVAATLDSITNDFSNSESQGCPNASQQV